MISDELLRQKIKYTRERKGISVHEIAERLHMDERNYKRIESGERKNIDVETAFKIAEVLEVDPLSLLASAMMNIEHIENNNIVGTTVYVNSDIEKHYKDIISEKDRITSVLNETIDAQNKMIEGLQKFIAQKESK